MRVEVLALFDSSVIAPELLQRMRDALRFLGFFCCWHDLAVNGVVPDPMHFAVVLALHSSVEQRWDNAFAHRLKRSIGAGTGFVSLDHRFPLNATWTPPLSQSGVRSVNSFQALKTDSFILAWKEAGERITWSEKLELTRLHEPRDYETLISAGNEPAVVRHRYRPIIRFLFDSLFWFAREFNDSLGMVDVLWRSIVWAARKPFACLSVPPFVTARIDNCNGRSGHFS